MVRANRPKITSETTPEQLFDVLAGMIEPFHDHHTYIDASNINRVYQGNRVGTDRLLKANGGEFRSKTMPALWAITNRLYITTPFRDFCNGQVQYARVDDRIGYLCRAWRPRLALRATTRLDGHSNADMDYSQAPTARISCQELTGIATASRKKEGIHVH